MAALPQCWVFFLASHGAHVTLLCTPSHSFAHGHTPLLTASLPCMHVHGIMHLPLPRWLRALDIQRLRLQPTHSFSTMQGVKSRSC